MITAQELCLDISREVSHKKIYVKQYDEESRYLKIHVTYNGRPIQIEQGSDIEFNMMRNSQEYEKATGTLESDGTLSILLPSWMLQVAGNYMCNVSITNGTERLSTLGFTTIVEESPSVS